MKTQSLTGNWEFRQADTADWSHLAHWPPYQTLRAAVAYPPVFYYTSTKDDRVQPGHARTAAATSQRIRRANFYSANMEGGHGGKHKEIKLELAKPGSMSRDEYDNAVADLVSFLVYICLLYTSDAADERSSVDLGGRRIIKKKKHTNQNKKKKTKKRK